ncbi:polyphosphate kinase 2 family protein [Acetobacteraceae bacterium H6797]|nr:polyphosphate kinase 2 family protein [Acetobacteraceae bacterium H6797]
MSRDSIADLLKACRVEKGKGFRLQDFDPEGPVPEGLDKEAAESLLAAQVERMAALQDMLYAQDRWAVLALFQAMDAAGKDGAIKHVFSGLNPQGCQVEAFKAPTATELDHDFLWRHVLHLPQRGRIGIHNRSWYEEVLVARVHPEVLARQRLPAKLVGKHIWDERLEDIAAFERYLARQGVVVLKFFLNVSKQEQKARFLARIAEPEKNWKFNAGDVAERRHWDAYQAAYEEAIRATATPASPWYVIPADRKWLTRLLVSEAILQAMEKLDLHYPHLAESERQALERARMELE